MTLEEMRHQQAVEQVLIAYASTCDTRQWHEFENVFAADVTANYGGDYTIAGRDNLVAMIRSMLGGCGATQHLLGNFRIAINGSQATCRCYVQANLVGVGDKSDMRYEVWAEYDDVLILKDGHWLICERKMIVLQELGSRDVLTP